MNYTTYKHIELNDLVWQIIKDYSIPIYNELTYNTINDAILDYTNADRGTGALYLRYPNIYTPNHWINEYIEKIMDKYFPEDKAIYLDR